MRPWYDDASLWCDTAETPSRFCSREGCAGNGDYPAPKSKQNLREYHWFCHDHVREYNAGWDFAKGLGPDDIEKIIRFDTVWQRETRPLGDWRTRERLMRASAEALREGKPRPKPHQPAPLPPAITDALGQLDLAWPLDEKTLRLRYRELVKKYHPDANGGDTLAGEKLKDINLAHAVLRDFMRKS